MDSVLIGRTRTIYTFREFKTSLLLGASFRKRRTLKLGIAGGITYRRVLQIQKRDNIEDEVLIEDDALGTYLIDETLSDISRNITLGTFRMGLTYYRFQTHLIMSWGKASSVERELNLEEDIFNIELAFRLALYQSTPKFHPKVKKVKI